MATVAEPIPLRALKTQVGGHFMMLEMDRDWICKPMFTRETFFYENLPNELKQFTPKYKGLIKVGFSPDKNNVSEYRYTAYPNLERDTPRSDDEKDDDQTALLVCSLGNIQSRETVTVLSSSEFDNGLSNSWIEFQMKRMSSAGLADNCHGQLQEHIILENLTGKFKCPCVMDLKLGTRTYSDIMSEEKKRKHSSRCANSTSKSLGVRLGGMQLYCQKDSKYYLMNKYYGHSLSENGLYETLERFLCSTAGQHKRDLMPQLIERLQHLREAIRQLNSYRLFSSSLLIMYEGAKDSETTLQRVATNTRSEFKTNPLNMSHCTVEQRVDVRIIDFSNMTNEYCSTDPIKYSGPDEGCIKGLTTVIDFYEKLMMRND